MLKKTLYIVAVMCVSLSGISNSQSLDLKKSIDLGLLRNQNIISASRKLDIASAKDWQAFSSMLPSLSISSNISRSYSSPMQTTFSGVPVSFGVDEAVNNKGWEATLSQTLFTFGKVESSVDMARYGVDIAKLELTKAKQDLVFEITSLYYGVIKSKKFVDLSKESLDMAKAHLDQVNALLSAGMATRSDVLRSEVAYSSAKQGLLKAQNGWELSKAAFNNAIGEDLNASVDIEGDDLAISDPSYVYDTLLLNSYSLRPDLKAIGISLKIADKSIWLAKASMLPSVALQGSYGSRNTDYQNNAINYDTNSWAVTAAAQWQLFDGFATQNKINEANYNYQYTKANYDLVKRAVELDVKQAYLNYQSAKSMIDDSKKGLESAQENNSVVEVRYKNGLATNIEILDAQTSLTKAKTDLLSAQFDLIIADAQIKKSAGW